MREVYWHSRLRQLQKDQEDERKLREEIKEDLKNFNIEEYKKMDTSNILNTFLIYFIDKLT